MAAIDKELIIEINYNINPNPTDISKLIKIQNDFLFGDYKRLILDFTESEFINAAVAVIIGTLCVYARIENKCVKFKFKNRTNNPIFKLMKQIGIYEYFTKCDIKYTTSNSIRFDRISDEDIMESYTDKILELAPIKITDDAKAILSSYFYEVYQNSLYHAKSPIDVFSSGYWMGKKKQLIFSVYDMGIGIPNNVKNHIDNSMTSKECLEWALTNGKSTREDELIKRGLGLNRLEQFIKLNNGTISIYTDNICCIINNKERKYIDLEYPIMGTLIIISIIADSDHIYIVRE